MAINISVHYNGGLLPDIILLTQCYYHRGTRLNAMKRFCICILATSAAAALVAVNLKVDLNECCLGRSPYNSVVQFRRDTDRKGFPSPLSHSFRLEMRVD